jgi:hypothetical protein
MGMPFRIVSLPFRNSTRIWKKLPDGTMPECATPEEIEIVQYVEELEAKVAAGEPAREKIRELEQRIVGLEQQLRNKIPAQQGKR